MTIWVVRAGRHGEREDIAIEQSRAFIGWDNLGDLSHIQTREELKSLMEEAYPDTKFGTVRNYTGQVFNFVKSIQIGDIFALPLKKQPAIKFGQFTGGYEYIANNPEGARHSRQVKWIGEPIPRSSFDKDILYSFGASMTIFSVTRNNAEEKVLAAIEGKEKPKTPTEVGSDISDDEESEILDLAQIARDQISDFISRNFKGYGLENLVAEVLKAQGFEVRPNPRKGPDGGVDILAGKGSMGFDEPHLCVQVKSSDSVIGREDYDKLKGVMQTIGAKHGLFVSWGGFNRNVEEENKRDFFHIRLWTADDLVSKIQDVYPNLPKEIQSELPMQQIWTLMDED